MEVLRAIEKFGEPSDLFLQVGQNMREKSRPDISQIQSTRKQILWQGKQGSRLRVLSWSPGLGR